MSTDNASSSLSNFSSLENRHTCDESAFTGRKGMRYDWQQVLVPSDTVFEASLETLLSSLDSQPIDAGDQSSPAAMK